MDEVMLYHTTNIGNFERMKQIGHIGLTQLEYEEILTAITDYYNICNFAFINKLYSKMVSFDERNDDIIYRDMLRNGCVSFFPFFEQCASIKIYGLSGGEQLSIKVKSTLRSIARHIKVPYKDLESRDDMLKNCCGIGTQPVVLQFKIPTNLLFEYSDERYKSGMEQISIKCVDMKYLQNVIPI